MQSVTTEEAFDILAEAANSRYADPDRENRGLCPAHHDVNNPGLVFRISDEGKLLAHCFARHCTIDDIAESIGVSISAFFPGRRGLFARKPESLLIWPSTLACLELLPLGYDDATVQRKRLFLINDFPEEMAKPPREIPYFELRDVFVWSWSWDWWVKHEVDWATPDHRGYGDKAVTFVMKKAKELRYNVLAQESAIPKGRA